MYNQIAFLDEWGNNGLDFGTKGVSTHFIITAIILPKEKLQEANQHVEAVRQKFFQTGVIKSSKVADNHIRRQLILRELLEAPFQIFTLVVDKRQIKSEGLSYKGSFFKFLHGLADRELYRIFPNLELVADNHGSESFMTGFVNYVKKNHIPDLFNYSSFGFVNDKSNVLIQAADFIAGTLARCYDETVISDRRQVFKDLMASKILALRYWPEMYEPSQVHTFLNEKQYNPMLAELGVNLAQDYLHKKLNSTAQQEIDQVTCISYLLFHF